MRILYILDPATIGGATNAFLSMTDILHKRGIDMIVCTSKYGKLNELLTQKGIYNIPILHDEMITRIPCGKKEKIRKLRKTLLYAYHDIRAIRIITKNINIKQIDLIHTNSSRSDVGFFLSKIYRIPHVVHLREFGDLDYDCYPLNPFYIKIYNKYADRFFCVSDAVKRHWIRQGIDSNKVVTIYDGIDYSTINISSDESKTEPILRLVMSGGIIPSKGQHIAIKAIGLLPKDVQKNITIDFIGWGDYNFKQSLVDKSIEYGFVNPIKFLGARNDIHQLLSKYHIGLMCSRSEGFGLVTAEFMFAKLGVIASDSGANPELIQDKQTGLIFENGNSENLAVKIMELYNNRELLVNLSNNARNQALLNFTSMLNADKVFEQYKIILARQGNTISN